MKYICVSMNHEEQILDSYLHRVFGGDLVLKKTVKTIRFPENRINQKGWSVKKFKSFCDMTVHDKNKLKLYKAKIVKEEASNGL